MTNVIDIKKRKDFVFVNKTGERDSFRGFIVLRAKKENQEKDRIGITVTKKTLGKANNRNRARRRIKEALRLAFHKRQTTDIGYDYIFIARAAALFMPFEDMLKDIPKIFTKRDRLTSSEKKAK